jgi:hypothetical protein
MLDVVPPQNPAPEASVLLRTAAAPASMGATVAGLAIGVTCAIAFERVLGSLLYGVTASDPMTLAV